MSQSRAKEFTERQTDRQMDGWKELNLQDTPTQRKESKNITKFQKQTLKKVLNKYEILEHLLPIINSLLWD